MSTSTKGPRPAPWRAAFLQQVYQLDPTAPCFVLSTVHPNLDSDSPPTRLPRARTVALRGMWAELSDNDRNPAERNPPGIWASDMLCITTDARMDKVTQIMLPGSEAGDAAVPEASMPHSAAGSASGGGGQFEAVFWVPAAKAQWRLRGTAYVLGPDIDSPEPAPSKVREVLTRRMRRLGGAEADWSWEREVTAHFGNMRPIMRGTFRNPCPGRPVSEGKGGEGLDLGQAVEDLQDKIARENFRVVVMVPDLVDRVDLAEDKRARRWIYGYVGEGGEGEETWKGDEGEDYLRWDGEIEAGWKITEVWP